VQKMISNYVIVIENTRYNQSELGETHTPSVFLPTYGWQQSEVKKWRRASSYKIVRATEYGVQFNFLCHLLFFYLQYSVKQSAKDIVLRSYSTLSPPHIAHLLVQSILKQSRARSFASVNPNRKRKNVPAMMNRSPFLRFTT